MIEMVNICEKIKIKNEPQNLYSRLVSLSRFTSELFKLNHGGFWIYADIVALIRHQLFPA